MLKVYPYIGIVGIKDRDEAIEVSKLIKDLNYKKSRHLVQIGVQVTPRVINNVRDKGINRRLPENLYEVANIFECTREILGDVFNVVHFSEKNKNNLVDRIAQIFDDTKIFSMGICKAVQLNGYLDEIRIEDLERIKKNYYKLKIIMQINRDMLDIFDHNGQAVIIEKIRAISRFIDNVLIDPSGGEGLAMNIWPSVKLAKAIKKEVPNLGIGFAGGLNWDNVYFSVLKIRQLLKSSNFSIDVESGLRDKLGDGYGNDDLNIEKVEHFYKKSCLAFEKDSYIVSCFKK